MSPREVLDSPAQAHRLAELARRYRPILARFFQRRIRPESDVDDLIQEVFARLARRGELEQIEGIEGYLFQIAANLIRERAHKLKRSAASKELYVTEIPNKEEDFSPERILLGEEEVRRVFAALHELPERTRHAFLLHRFEDMKHVEIARRLNVAVSTVEKDIMRAMAHLLKRVR